MTVTTPAHSDAGPRPVLADARVTRSTLRRMTQLAVAVVLITAGLLVGVHVNPELGATLLLAGIHQGMEGIVRGGEDDSCHPLARLRRSVGIELA